jgi:hypothetical protein
MARAWPILYTIIIGIGLATCAPLLHDFKLVQSTIPKRQSSPSSCGFTGNSDFYGLGIRIGIYLQWITAFLANHFLREAIDLNLETNTIFLLALFIATVVATIKDTVQTSEIIVLLHLCFGFLFSILSVWGHRTGRWGIAKDTKTRFPLIGSFFRLTLATALSAYGLWFWFRGRGIHHRTDGCNDFTFMFGKFDAAGSVSVFFEIQSSAIIFVYAILFAREFLMIVCFFTFMTIQTALIAGVMVWFRSGLSKSSQHQPVRSEEDHHESANCSREDNGRPKRRIITSSNIPSLFTRWVGLWFAMGWKQANGKESAGENRPGLDNYLVAFIDITIFLNRTVFQYFCLFFFKKCPSMDFIPMIRHPLAPRVGPENIWTKINKSIREAYE